MSIPLTCIYNHSIETGIVPDILKVSQVSPVYKGGDATDPSNYRPIATLSPFSKVLERLVYNQLYSFIDKHQILYKYQFGFRKGYSTEQAILEITDNLKLATDKGQITSGLFLDRSKAFDTVNYEILLSKLYLYGPLLFLLYVNDFPNCVDKLSVRSFADDTNLFYSSDNLKQLESVMNQELKQVYNYYALNKLFINIAKTNYMLVSSSRCHPKINITGFEQKDYIKYLGVYIDKHLNWQPQIQHVNIELEYTETNLLCFNISVFELRYSCLGCASKTRLDCLRIKHNKCLRTIFFVHPRESADPYFKLLTILKLDNIYKLKICCFIHRMRNETDSIPDIFLDVLTPASRIHNHNTRFVSNLNYFRRRVSTNLGKTSFKLSAPKIWETVPPGLKCLPYRKFKKEWKSCLLTNQI